MLNKFKNLIKWKLKGEVPTEYLIKRGLKVGQNFVRMPECIIDYPHCYLISIGNNVGLGPRVHILAHDASTKLALGYTKIGLVEIGDNVFIGANSVILPNVKIGNNVIIGAGSIINKDVPDNSVVGGNPAKVICSTYDYIEKNKSLMKVRPLFDESYTISMNVTEEKKQEMIESLKGGLGFLR